MRLIDYYIPLVSCLLEMEPLLSGQTDLNVDQVRAKFEAEKTTALQRLEHESYSEDDINSALFAIAVLADEKILSSSWQHKEDWSYQQLQREWFDTSNGGVEFFTRLDTLNSYNPRDVEVKEVYFYCLALGFRGRYFEEGQQSIIDQIIATTAQTLQDSLDLGNRLFPMAYNDSAPPPVTFRTRFNWLPVIVGAPLVGIILLYFYYRYDILNVSEQILRSL
jgi:type VI secretion system protein ImpK